MCSTRDPRDSRRQWHLLCVLIPAPKLFYWYSVLCRIYACCRSSSSRKGRLETENMPRNQMTYVLPPKSYLADSHYARVPGKTLAYTCGSSIFPLTQQGMFDQVKTLQVKASDIIEKFLGPDHPQFAASLNNRASLWEEQVSMRARCFIVDLTSGRATTMPMSKIPWQEHNHMFGEHCAKGNLHTCESSSVVPRNC